MYRRYGSSQVAPDGVQAIVQCSQLTEIVIRDDEFWRIVERLVGCSAAIAVGIGEEKALGWAVGFLFDGVGKQGVFRLAQSVLKLFRQFVYFERR